MNENKSCKQYTNEDVMAGYWKDAKGALVPVSMIKDIDIEREQVVEEIIKHAKLLNKELSLFKAKAFGDIAAFIELSAEQYNVNLGGKKGNVTLFSFDGKYKVQRTMHDNIAPDERILAAKQLTMDCVNDWSENARPELKAIVNRAFATSKDGDLKLGRLLELRRLDIKDERWQKAMDALSESLQVVGSRSYIRVYERIGDSNEYRPIALDIAGV
ncbi:DUF3164 family protein [Gilliamella sp. Fer4-1]|uniref:DUF3164 family protein n=1 Tax=Gilliamella sp. Fer4-1 TaxID=3120242 RepID=UPI00080EC02B|nr:DUF3164 family protein [Gilliamella apicola]OCG62220.1 sulfate transporter [Gilliamella apicola]